MSQCSISHQYPAAGPRPRAGYTLAELMIVVLIMGIMASLLVKPVVKVFGASARRSARREAVAYLFRARTIAIQQSRTSQLVRSGNTLKIRVDSSGTMVRLGTVRDLGVAYGVTLTTSPSGADTTKFDPRGFRLNTTTPKIIVTRDAVADTVCATGLGKIMTGSCP